MKTSEGLKSLKEEYKKYDVGENKIDSLRDFGEYLSKVVFDVDRYLERAFSQMQANEKWRSRAKIKNLLPILFAKEDIATYDYDDMILMEMSNLAIYNLEFFNTMNELANEENYQELNKLTNFILDYFEKNSEYLALKRKTIDGNIEIDESKHQYNLELINDFVNEKLSGFEKQKQYLKK